MMKIKYIFAICSMFFIIPCMSSCSIYKLLTINYNDYRQSIIDLETRIVQENDNVLSAEVLSDDGVLKYKLSMLITFKNNQWMRLANVREDQDNIRINSINGYLIYRYAIKIDGSETVPYGYEGAIDILVTGRKLSINEMIENFDKMAAYIDNLEEITDKEIMEIYSRGSYSWFWSDEANLRKRIINNHEIIDFKTISRYIVLENSRFHERLRHDEN